MRQWVAIVTITDRGRDGTGKPQQLVLGGGTDPLFYHSKEEIVDALHSLGDCPLGVGYSWILHEVSMEPNHYDVLPPFKRGD